MQKYPNVTAGQTEAAINILGGWESFQKVLSGEILVTLTAKVKSILSLLGSVTFAATKKFVARDNFRIGKAGIGWMGENFKNRFLGKTEEPAPEATLRYHKLNESSLDGPILAELGDKTETTLANLFSLLSLQTKGQSGILLTNGYANIFYVRDAAGELRAVGADWRSGHGGWHVRAFTVTGPHGWRAGNQVFSRNSCLPAGRS
ncbi:MAG: hypothetical protein Q7T18_08235 [Sedimentisphaerales bacterium]|nr:hypothetical protein [Sedimentisphaerales bacterium]